MPWALPGSLDFLNYDKRRKKIDDPLVSVWEASRCNS